MMHKHQLIKHTDYHTGAIVGDITMAVADTLIDFVDDDGMARSTPGVHQGAHGGGHHAHPRPSRSTPTSSGATAADFGATLWTPSLSYGVHRCVWVMGRPGEGEGLVRWACDAMTLAGDANSVPSSLSFIARRVRVVICVRCWVRELCCVVC